MSLLSASPLPFYVKLIVIGAVAAAIGGAYWAWHHHVYEQGYEAALAQVTKENGRAVDAAEKARARLRGCDVDGGMRWSQSTGQCVRGDL